MRFYIATSLEAWAAHNAVRDRLQQNPGWELTYDWTAHGSVQHEGVDRVREVALAETEGVMDADFVVGILPGGRGTHCELGIAIGASIPIILLVPHDHSEMHPHTCAFYHHPLVRSLHLGAGEKPEDAHVALAIEACLVDWPWHPLMGRRFEERVASMRVLQERYFKTRDGGVLQRAKVAEQAVDKMLEATRPAPAQIPAQGLFPAHHRSFT